MKLVFAVIFLGVSLCHGQDESLNFFIVGDFGGVSIPPYTTPYQVAVANEMGRLAPIVNAEFILALGDNFYWVGVTDVEDPRFNQTFENIYDDPSLFIPWYLLAGNHDHEGNVTAQILYSDVSERWNFPSLYYKVSKVIPGQGGGPDATLDIIMFDRMTLCDAVADDFMSFMTHKPWTQKEEELAEEQWLWLDQTMQESTADYLIVAGHHPVWSVGEHGPTTCLRDRLMPMLHKYQVSAYICGHDHQQQLIVTEFDNAEVHYVVTGVANSVNPIVDNQDAVPEGSLRFLWRNIFSLGGFAHVHATTHKSTWTFIEGNGDEQYTFDIFPRHL